MRNILSGLLTVPKFNRRSLDQTLAKPVPSIANVGGLLAKGKAFL
jgi:hypothetical protein